MSIKRYLATGGFAQPLGRGTYASRPSSGSHIGYEWIQTDTAGGNPAGTRTRWNGSGWDVTSISQQLTPLGMQGSTWITSLPSWGNSAPGGVQVTMASGHAFLSLFRPSKDITVSSVGAYLASNVGTENYDLGIYRLDGATLTRLGALGSSAVPTAQGMVRRVLPSSIALSAGATYYFAASSNIAGGLYMFGYTSTNVWATFIGGAPGDFPSFRLAGSLFPLPGTIDTGTWSASAIGVWPFMAASSLT